MLRRIDLGACLCRSQWVLAKFLCLLVGYVSLALVKGYSTLSSDKVCCWGQFDISNVGMPHRAVPWIETLGLNYCLGAGSCL